MNSAVIICSRLNSSRIPRKALKSVCGQPLLDNLISRLKKTNLPIIIAVPVGSESEYSFLKRHHENLEIFAGDPSDPMRRMNDAATKYNVENIIRVTHDKVFVDPDEILRALKVFEDRRGDYLFSSKFVDGSSFEIIKKSIIDIAVSKYKDVEFVSYCAKILAKNKINYTPIKQGGDGCRLLVDYPDDLLVIESILCEKGLDCTLDEAVQFLTENKKIKQINKMPKVTVYTCAYNSSDFIERCMLSVWSQITCDDIEYILVDDCSTDDTFKKMVEFSSGKSNVSVIRNQKNLGLASSSNIALSRMDLD